MYRLIIATVFIFLALATWTGVAAAEPGAVVIKASEFPKGGFQRIGPADMIILDAKGFLFPGEAGTSDASPDTIALHIQYDGGSFYSSAPLAKVKRRDELNAVNLRARGKAPPFSGLPKGASAFLLVGKEVGGSSLDIGVFADQWNLMLRVE
ncbi:hypothetical protein ACFL4N_05095 [Thermodesulfobacteriota bacterium]